MSLHIQGRSKSMAPVLFWAQMYLQSMRREWPQSNLSVVFDIDDTAIPVRTGTVMPEFKDLYALARQLDYFVFFVTARPDVDGNRASTLKQLRESGFDRIDGLFLMPTDHLFAPNFSEFKFSQRKRLFDSGYNIVLNAGDAWHDLMLLPPFQTDPARTAAISQLLTLPKSEYIIFRPPDLAWMAIKFREFRPLPEPAL